MGPYYMNLPRQEPPESVKAAIRTVRAWLASIHAEEMRGSEEFQRLLAERQAAGPPRDWRNEV